MTEMVCLQSYSNREFAEFAKSVLEANDIPGMLSGADLGGFDLSLATGGVKLFVWEVDSDRARQILADLQTGVDEAELAEVADGVRRWGFDEERTESGTSRGGRQFFLTLARLIVGMWLVYLVLSLVMSVFRDL